MTNDVKKDVHCPEGHALYKSNIQIFAYISIRFLAFST